MIFSKLYLIQIAFDFPISFFLMLTTATIKVFHQGNSLKKGKRRIYLIQFLIWISVPTEGLNYINKLGVSKFGSSLIFTIGQTSMAITLSVSLLLTMFLISCTLVGLSKKDNWLAKLGKKMLGFQIEVAEVLSDRIWQRI